MHTYMCNAAHSLFDGVSFVVRSAAVTASTMEGRDLQKVVRVQPKLTRVISLPITLPGVSILVLITGATKATITIQVRSRFTGILLDL